MGESADETSAKLDGCCVSTRVGLLNSRAAAELLSRSCEPFIVPLVFSEAHANIASDVANRLQPLVSESLDLMWADEPIVCFEEGEINDRALSQSEQPDLRERAEQTRSCEPEVPFPSTQAGASPRVVGAAAFSAAKILSSLRRGALVGSDELWGLIPRGGTMFAVFTGTG